MVKVEEVGKVKMKDEEKEMEKEEKVVKRMETAMEDTI
jgi:hypothetical protein